jgi:hypothetical protein
VARGPNPGTRRIPCNTTSVGKPGERDYHPGYYAAFLIDPDGNNIEAVCHGPAKRSAASVLIEADVKPNVD